MGVGQHFAGLAFAIKQTPLGVFYLDDPLVTREWGICVPYAWLVGLGVVIPARHLIPAVGRWSLRRRGRCSKCGYDLHATPDRCPECGTAVLSS